MAERNCENVNDKVAELCKKNESDHREIWRRMDEHADKLDTQTEKLDEVQRGQIELGKRLMEIRAIVSEHRGVISTAKALLGAFWTLLIAAIGAAVIWFKDGKS